MMVSSSVRTPPIGGALATSSLGVAGLTAFDLSRTAGLATGTAGSATDTGIVPGFSEAGGAGCTGFAPVADGDAALAATLVVGAPVGAGIFAAPATGAALAGAFA